MKKVYLFLAVLGLSVSSFAQNLNMQIFDHNHNEVTNGVYQIPLLHSAAPTTDVHFYLKNNTGADLNVKVTRQTVVMPAGYENAMCFSGFCFPSDKDTTTFEQLISAGVMDSSFKVTIFNNQNTTGDFSVNYTIYDIANPANDVTVKIYYANGLTASVVENVSESASVSAYPNPASGSVVIKHTLLGEGQLLISDITGKTLKNIRLNSGPQSTQVDISDLKSGVYVYSIQSGSKRIVSKKLVVR